LKDIRRATRRHFSAEDKIRIVLDGLRGDDSIAELCRREGIAQSLYYGYCQVKATIRLLATFLPIWRPSGTRSFIDLAGEFPQRLALIRAESSIVALT
jgi:hypothetical protein